MDELHGLSRFSIAVLDVQASRFCNNQPISHGYSRETHAGLTVIRAVAARNQLLVLSLEREPGFQIILYRRGVVQRAGNDVDNSVRQAEGLVKGFTVGDHRVEHLGRLFGFRDAELGSQGKLPTDQGNSKGTYLFDLFELVDSENAPSVLAVCAGFLSETGRVTGVPARVVDEWGSKGLRFRRLT